MDEHIIEFDTLKTRILKYILYKKRTEQEIRNKFNDVDENMLEDAIEYLKEAGYINDKEYIKRAIAEFIKLKTMSIKEIEYKLYAKGLNKYEIDNYINEHKEMLEEYEKESTKKIFIKKQSIMDLKDIVLFLKKKGYKEESICYGMEEMD